MKNVVRTSRLWAVLCLLGCLILPMVHHSGSALYAQAQPVKTVINAPIDYYGYNPCAEELFHITGTIIITIHENISASGNYNLSIHGRAVDGEYTNEAR